MRLLRWRLAAILVIAVASQIAHALDSDEVKALGAMRAAWGSTAPMNWTGPPSCSWEGIRCSATGHVAVVDVHGAGMKGLIPPEVGLLHELVILYVLLDLFFYYFFF